MAVLVLTPSYDPLTSLLSEWCERVNWRGLECTVVTGRDVTKSALREFLDRHSGEPNMVVFCGHGEENALLGPPESPDREHSDLCDTRMVQGDRLTHWLAWCCFSGRGFGPFVAYHPRSAFFGFGDRILLPRRGHDSVLEPLDRLFRGCLESGGLTDLLVQDFRGDLKARLKRLAGKPDPDSTFARLSLRLMLDRASYYPVDGQ